MQSQWEKKDSALTNFKLDRIHKQLEDNYDLNFIEKQNKNPYAENKERPSYKVNNAKKLFNARSWSKPNSGRKRSD